MAAWVWLLMMTPPSAILLIVGITAVRRKYGGVRHVLGIVAVVAGVLLAVTTIAVLPGISTTTTPEEPPPTAIPKGG